MAKSFLMFSFLLLSYSSRAQFLGFGENKSQFKSKLTSLIDKINQLEVSAGPQFEESFNQNIQLFEATLDQEILFCSGEASNDKGQYISNDKRQTCIRELKQKYTEGVVSIFEIKKKYLEVILEIHKDKLQKAQAQAVKNIDNRF